MRYTLTPFAHETDMATYVEKYVDIAQFLTCCQACPCYNQAWSCPPYDFDPMDIWNAYQRIQIYGYRIDYHDIADEDFETGKTYMESVLWQVKDQVSAELFAKEKELPGSLSLSAGTCHLCDRCTKPDGEPCRNPEVMRYSIESLGGNVGTTLSDFCGIDLEWVEDGKLPSHYVLCGALLMP